MLNIHPTQADLLKLFCIGPIIRCNDSQFSSSNHVFLKQDFLRVDDRPSLRQPNSHQVESDSTYWSRVSSSPRSWVQLLPEKVPNLVSDQWYEATPSPNRKLISHTRRPLNRWSLRYPWLIYKCAAGLKVMRLCRRRKLCSLTQCMQIFKELYSELLRTPRVAISPGLMLSQLSTYQITLSFLIL